MPQPAAYSDALRAADLRACRSLLRGGSRSFYAASFLLPRRVRDPATALYAFCRLADDAVDLGHEGTDAIAVLRRRLDAAYHGVPAAHPADRAFADAVACYAIPKELPEALLDGFAWDKAGHTYETIDELLNYAARVAGTVGAMMALLMGRREKEAVARACDLGMAMQLTNIARDIGEDALAGRLYMPRAWMREAGLDPEAWMNNPVFCQEIADVTRRILGAADRLYEQADAGIGRLPADCRPGITAARLLYSEIGNAVALQGWNSVDRRAVVPSVRKAELLANALRSLTRTPPWRAQAPSEASRFLVDAASASACGGTGPVAGLAWWDVRGRMLFVLALFERLERRERAYLPSQQSVKSLSARQVAEPV